MADSRDIIIARMLNNVPNDYDKTVGSFFYDAEKPMAIEAERIYQNVETTLDQAFVQTASGTNLDKVLESYGLPRLEETYASGYVTFYGEDGTYIADDTLCNSAKCSYLITMDGVIADGSVTLPVVALQSGVRGNAEISEINQSGYDGVTVSNESPILNGRDRETDSEARARFINYMKHPAAGGNKYDYVNWAYDASGNVGAALCVPLWNGTGTISTDIGTNAGYVTVVIAGKNNTETTEALCDTVKNYIDDIKPIGCNLVVKSATNKSITITANLTLQSGFSQSQVIPKIKAKISEYFDSIALKNAKTIVSPTRVGSCILDVEGVEDYDTLKLDGGSTSLQLTAGYMPKVGTFNGV